MRRYEMGSVETPVCPTPVGVLELTAVALVVVYLLGLGLLWFTQATFHDPFVASTALWCASRLLRHTVEALTRTNRRP
jgi:hypothetical protein